MYINKITYFIAQNQSTQKPRENFMTFCHDLHRYAGGNLCEKYLNTVFGFSFVQLLEQWLDHDKNILSFFDRASYCIILHTAPEYDALYSHVGAYLIDRYRLSCQMIDISGQGNVSVCTALHFYLLLFSQSTIERAIILGFDQSIFPVVKNHLYRSIENNGVALLSCDLLPGQNRVSLKVFFSNSIFIPDEKISLHAEAFRKRYQSSRDMPVYYCFVTTAQACDHFVSLNQTIQFQIFHIAPGILPVLHVIKQIDVLTHLQIRNALYIIFLEDAQWGERGVLVLLSE